MNIKIDSRKINKGDTFVAIENGHKYIKDAIKNGASMIVCEKGKYSVKTKRVKNTRIYLAKYLKKYYYNQIKDIKLIGITGTNGKTTSAYLIYQALNKAKIKCAYIGTIGYFLDGKVKNLNNTTPEILDLYDMILDAKSKNAKVIVMEVSSHSLSLKRVYNLEFDYAIFTNLTMDHLDYHKSIRKYFKAKKKLFKMLKKDGKGIINVDSKYGKKIYKKGYITIGKENAKYLLKNYEINDKTYFMVNNNRYEMNLFGLYNIYNMMNTIVILDEFHIKNKYEIIKRLVPPKGRMEIINYGTNKVIIDYAHTPDAVLNILNCVKEFAKSKIYVIIGCGGNRDKYKRPIMAKIASLHANYVILTSDNPRFEDPISIIKDMENGISKDNYKVVVNRSEAIENGVQLLKNNDILLLLGKGHETYQIINNEKKFFDDKLEVLKYIGR